MIEKCGWYEKAATSPFDCVFDFEMHFMYDLIKLCIAVFIVCIWFY